MWSGPGSIAIMQPCDFLLLFLIQAVSVISISRTESVSDKPYASQIYPSGLIDLQHVLPRTSHISLPYHCSPEWPPHHPTWSSTSMISVPWLPLKMIYTDLAFSGSGGIATTQLCNLPLLFLIQVGSRPFFSLYKV